VQKRLGPGRRSRAPLRNRRRSRLANLRLPGGPCRQREFAGQLSGAVLDGRDTGTVIAPDATAKLFVTAAPEIRARRRFDELVRRGKSVHFDEVLTDIRARDARDSGRTAAPLLQAIDASLLDTGAMTVDQAIAAAIALVDERLC
jgi:cytidylate kinase